MSEPRAHIEKRIHDPEVQRLLELAREYPAVRQELLPAEQAAYLMAWKEQVNPDSEPFRLFYPAMGPDISSALLATNCTEIDMIDRHAPSGDMLNHALSEWKKSRRSFKVDLRDEDDRMPPFQNIINNVGTAFLHRYQFGYHSNFDISYTGIEHILMGELYKLIGNDMSTVNIAGTDEIPELRFMAAYPGEDPKQRVIRFMRGDIIDQTLPGKEFDNRVPHIDGMLQKAHMDTALVGKPENFSVIMKKLRPGGVIVNTLAPNPFMAGRYHSRQPSEEPAESSRHYAQVRRDQTLNFNETLAAAGCEPLSVSLSANKLIVNLHSPTLQNISAYGNYLVGARKIGQPD